MSRSDRLSFAFGVRSVRSIAISLAENSSTLEMSGHFRYTPGVTSAWLITPSVVRTPTLPVEIVPKVPTSTAISRMARGTRPARRRIRPTAPLDGIWLWLSMVGLGMLRSAGEAPLRACVARRLRLGLAHFRLGLARAAAMQDDVLVGV